MHIRRAVGRISVLEDVVAETPLPEAQLGMAHTRWATHGAPTEVNAHPHTDDGGRIALVHNGIVENYAALKKALMDEGQHKFVSQTDTEVLAMLVGDFYAQLRVEKPGENVLAEAVQDALKQVQGTYGIAVICKDE